MKIVCESCSAKYSIADEKVAGRVFKIRCKKCGAAIVVRGDQVDGADDAAEPSTRVVDYGGEAVWHVVVEGDQQGPFSPAQIGEMLSAGTIGWDAFVWREGFDDWKPAQEIDELVQAVMGGSQEADAVASAEPDPFAATQHAAAASGEASAGFGASEAAVRAKDPGADLFAQSAASPFGGGGDEEEDVVASAPGPRVSAEQALTGARNENSVLFSLSNLQALATGAPGGPAPSSSPSPSAASPAAGPRPGMAAGEGSGLIDIRALASATGVTPGNSGPVTSASNDKVDDLLSIGGAGSVGLGSSLGAPVLIPEKKEESNKGVFVMAGAAVVVAMIAAAAVVAVFIIKDDPAPPIAAAGMLPPGQTVPGATAVADPAPAPTPDPTPPTAAAPAAEPAPAQPAQPAEPTAEAPAAAAGGASPSSEGSSSRRGSRGGSSGSSTASGSSGGGSAAPSTGSSSSSSRGGGGGGGDIDDLLNQAIGGGGSRRGGASAPAPAAGGGGGGNLPPSPSRTAVVSAMGSVASAVSACADGNTGLAPVRIVFANTGRVTTAEVTATNLPPPVRSCIARAVRNASVPPFSQPSFSVNYPFRL